MSHTVRCEVCHNIIENPEYSIIGRDKLSSPMFVAHLCPKHMHELRDWLYQNSDLKVARGCDGNI